MIIGNTGIPLLPFDLSEYIGPAEYRFSPVPYYTEPSESPLTDNDFPLVYTSGRFPHYHHNTLRNIPFLRELMPVPELWIHPDTAKQYGIEDGGWVKASSRRGTTTFKAKLTVGVNPRVVTGERFWFPEMLEEKNPSGGWKEMNMQILASCEPPYCPESGSYTLRGFQVKIEKGERPQGIWERPEDFTPWLPEPTDTTEVTY